MIKSSRFEEIGSSIEENGEEEDGGGGGEQEDDVGDNISSDGTIRSTRKKKPPREHVNINLEELRGHALYSSRFPIMKWLK